MNFRKVLNDLEFFNTFPPWIIEKLAGAIRIKQCTKKQVVFKEGDEVDNLYIVKDGEFERTKNFAIVVDLTGTTQLQGISPGPLSEPITIKDPEEEKKATGDKSTKNLDLKNMSPAKNSNQDSPRSPMKYMNNKAGEKTLKIKSFTQNEIFGEDEIIMKQKLRQSTVMCSTQTGTLYVLSKESLHNAIKESTNSASNLQKHVEENVSIAKKKLGDAAKVAGTQLPKIKLLTQKKHEPLTNEERKAIKKKIDKFNNDRLLRRLKKNNPRYSIDMSYQYYDSKVLRGEVEPLSLHEMLKRSKPILDPELINALQNAGKDSKSARTIEEPINRERSDSIISYEASKKYRELKNRPRRQRSDSIRKKAEKELDEMLSSESPSPLHNRNYSSTFVTALGIQSSIPEPIESHPSLLPTICEPISEPKEESKGVPVISQALNDVAAEMVEQYKAMNNGSTKINKKDIPTVLNTILQSNKYLQNLIKNVKYTQKKVAQKISKSKHNMYRFKSGLK